MFFYCNTLAPFTHIYLPLFPVRSHRGLPDGLLASQPGPPPHDGRRAKDPLDHLLLPELRHPPAGGRHLLLPELGHQPVPLQLVLQTVQGGLRPGAAMPPDHRTRQQAQREELPPRLGALAAAAGDKIFPS